MAGKEREAALAVARFPLHSIMQRIPGLTYLLFVAFCLFSPMNAPLLFAVYYFILHILFLYNNIRTLWGTRSAYYGAIKHSQTNWAKEFMRKTGASSPSDSRYDMCFTQVKHVIIIPQYKEELETIYDTLDVLASHEMARKNYKVDFN
jgi:hypothetical protein